MALRIHTLTEKTAREMPAGFYVYFAEALTRFTGQFDGTKFGVSKAEAGLWGRLRSHATNVPFGKILVIEFDTAEAMNNAENECKKGIFPRLAFSGGIREYTDVTPEIALERLLEVL